MLMTLAAVVVLLALRPITAAVLAVITVGVCAGWLILGWAAVITVMVVAIVQGGLGMLAAVISQPEIMAWVIMLSPLIMVLIYRHQVRD